MYLRANGIFQILKSSENVKSRGLDRVTNENLFPQTLLDKRLETNSQNLAKKVFLWNVLQLNFCNFLPKNVQTWTLVGRWVLGIKYKHFRDFLEIS